MSLVHKLDGTKAYLRCYIRITVKPAGPGLVSIVFDTLDEDGKTVLYSEEREAHTGAVATFGPLLLEGTFQQR